MSLSPWSLCQDGDTECPNRGSLSKSSLHIEGKHFTHADTKKLNHDSWGEREEADNSQHFF